MLLLIVYCLMAFFCFTMSKASHRIILLDTKMEVLSDEWHDSVRRVHIPTVLKNVHILKINNGKPLWKWQLMEEEEVKKAYRLLFKDEKIFLEPIESLQSHSIELVYLGTRVNFKDKVYRVAEYDASLSHGLSADSYRVLLKKIIQTFCPKATFVA